jgi:hypothetical protein
MTGFASFSSSTVSSWLASWRFAPVTTMDNWTQRPSTRINRFVPFFSPISGVWSNCFVREGCFAHAAVDGLPFPGDPSHIIVFRQTALPEFQEKSLALPFPEIPVNRSWTAENFFGQGLPLNSGSQYEHNSRKGLTRLHWLSATANLAFVLFFPVSFWVGNQWFDNFPKYIRQFP